MLLNNHLNLNIIKDILLEICKETEKLSFQVNENSHKIELISSVNNTLHNINNDINLQIKILKNMQMISSQLQSVNCEIQEKISNTSLIIDELIQKNN